MWILCKEEDSHEKIKPYFLQKIKVKKIKCRLLQFLFGALRVKVTRYISESFTFASELLRWWATPAVSFMLKLLFLVSEYQFHDIARKGENLWSAIYSSQLNRFWWNS